MAALSDRDIRKSIAQGILRIVPLKDEQIGPASIDLTLGREWWLFKPSYLHRNTVDLKKTGFRQAMRKMRSASVVLPPGGMCLGKTVEKIYLPPTLIGRLEGRSRYARMGLSVHITAAVVQPGSRNHQVLEIVNFAPFPVALHAGMQISQIIFHELRTSTSKPYARYGHIGKTQ